MKTSQNIQDKLKYLFENTPEYVGVMFGKKMVNGNFTEEDGIIFTVEKKKAISELSKDEILPSTVEINNKIYKTDVIEVGKTRLIACDCENASNLSQCYNCDPDVINNCYTWLGYPYYEVPDNRGFVRPLRGGVKIVAHNSIGSINYAWGTLGFIAVDNMTSALVGITNNHVVINNAFYTADRHPNDIIENEINNPVYQPYIDEVNNVEYPHSYDNIGQVLRYVPISSSVYNQVDAAMLSVDSSVISFSESFKQFNLSWNYPMDFATEGEINALTPSTPVYSSGGRTGVKIWGSLCSLQLYAISSYFPMTYPNGSYETTIFFEDSIIFKRFYTNCPCPVTSGDSGSALIANIGGVWKIIGLIFASNNLFGLACKITNVASQLGISAWMGETRPFVNLNSQEIITLPAQSALKTLDCPSGKTYWQIGNTNISQPCNV